MTHETMLPSGHGSSTSPQRPSSSPSEAEPADALLVDLYDELRGMARHWFAGQPPNHTLQPTAIVHEAYLRLAASESTWRSRTHFFAIAAQAMRQVLIDHARRRQASKRGGAWCRIDLADDIGGRNEVDIDVLSLHEALEQLAALNERQCRVVELRFLAGLTVEESARVLGLSPRTVKLEWRMARAWLLARLLEGPR